VFLVHTLNAMLLVSE